MGNLTVKESGEVVNIISPNVSKITSFKVHFSPKQEGTGDPSPENVREITGWDGVRVGLPDEYQEVEWIQSTEEKQFILLPYGFEETDTVTITASIGTEYSIDKFIIAPTTWNDNNNRFAMAGVYADMYCVGYGNRTTNYTPLKPKTNNDGGMHTWTFANKVFEITDLGLSINVSNITFGGVTSNLKLFYGYNHNVNGKLSYYKHVKLNGEVYEFIPCYRKSDGEIGLYDIKNHVFYTNNGAGSFLKGKDVNNIATNISWKDEVGTIYGGYVDLISGELVQEYFKYSFTGDEDIFISDYVKTPFLFNTTTNDLTMPFGNNPNVKPYCNILNTETSKYHYISDNTAVINSISRYSQVLFRGDIFGDTAETAKAKLKELYENGTPLTIVGTIRDTVIDNFKYQLTPQQLSTLKGQNNFWSNADYVEIEYELTETFDIQKAKRKIILNQPHVESASGDIVTFDTDMKGKLKECKVYFNPVQEGEGDPSPDNVRNITGWNGVRVGLPDEYQEVEYIESTGTQYIDTGITLGTNDFTILFNFEQTERTSGEQPITSIWTTDYNYWNLFIRSVSSDKIVLDVYTSAHHMLSTEVNLNEKYTVSLTRNENSWELTQGDSTISWTYSPSKINNTTLKLFKRGDLSTMHSTKIKIYSFKMTISNTRTLNLIPCYRKSDSEIGMYDSVSKQFFTNQGTDTFLKGNDVNGIHASIDWTDDVGTVYGGYVDLVNGELVVDRRYIDSNEIASAPSSKISVADQQNGIWVYRVNDAEDTTSNIVNTKLLSNVLPTNRQDYLYNGGNGGRFGCAIWWTKHIGIVTNDTTVNTSTLFRQWCVDNSLQIIYPIDTPIHYQLTPQQILTLKGTNNVYSDANGQTEIKYWKH